jgi:hypothetical protein
VRKHYRKGRDERGSFNLTIDSLAIAIPIGTSTVSPSKFFHSYPTTPYASNVPLQGHLAPPLHIEKDRPSYPRAQAPQDQLKNGAKGAKPTLRQKGDEDPSKPAVLKHKYVDFQLKCSKLKHNLPRFPSSSPRMNEGGQWQGGKP